MNKNYLLDELKKVQKEYLQLLKSINIDDKLIISIDSLSVFWYRNKPLVDLALDYLHRPYEGIVFTAATSLNIDNNDIYPLLLFGDCHFIDDPIFRISRTGLIPDENKFTNYMLDSAKNIISNTIKLIEKYGNYVFVIPIRLFYEMSIGRADTGTEKVFLDLFQGKMTMAKYWQIKDIVELEKALLDDVKNHLPFFQGDNMELDLATRLENFKNESELPEQSSRSATEIFFMAVYSKMGQAIDVTRMSIASYIIPFVRDFSALYYIDNMFNHLQGKIESIDLIRYRAQICSFVYKVFDRNIIKDLSLEKFEKIRKSDFITDVWNNTDYSLSTNKTYKRVEKMLEEFYKQL